MAQTLTDEEEAEYQPLLRPASSTSSIKHSGLSSDSDDDSFREVEVLRSVDSDVLPETATYGRNLGWWSAYILIMSRVIGSGIFATPGSIAKSVGSVGLTLLLWLVGAIISACGLAITMEYGCMLPRSGGEKVYLEFTYRHPRYLASTLVAVQAVLLGFTASNCIVFGEYVLFALDIEPAELVHKTLAVGLLTVITIVHGCFLKTGILIQDALGFVKIALCVFMGFTGLYVVIFRPHTASGAPPNTEIFGWENLWKDSNWSWGILSTALFKVFYSYAGLNNVNNVLNEVKNPVRTLKTVGPAALFSACVLYLLVNVAYFVIVPIDELKESRELVAALFFEKVFGPGFGKIVLPLAIAISAAGNVMVVTYALARVNKEVARQGFLPYASILASSRPFDAPLGGLIVHYIPSFLVIALPPPGDVYTFILDVEGYPGQFFALASSVGILLLRYRRPDLKRPFKAWLPAVALRIALCLALITAPFFPPEGWRGDVDFFYATYAIVGIGIILFAVLYWYVWTIALPRWRDYTLEEKVEVLPDGTSITKLVHSNPL